MARDMDEYVKKSDVVRVALEVAKDQGWCIDGVKERLAELDIEIPRKRVSVTIPVSVTVIVDVPLADDDDDALETARESVRDIGFEIEHDSWSVDDDDIDGCEMDTWDVRHHEMTAEVL